MREYQRATKECNFRDLPAETVQAFNKFIEKEEMGSIETQILMCCETVSTRIKKGLFGGFFGGGNFAQQTTIFFTPEWLFWCTTDQSNERTVLSARLNEIEIKDFKSDLIEDSGLQIYGFINHSPERVQAFIGLDEEAVGQKFRQLLKETVGNSTK